MNVKKPHRGLIGAEKDYALFSVVHNPDDTITYVYLNSKGKKGECSFMRLPCILMGLCTLF